MKCDPTTKRYSITVPADNSFRLILPLKTRTYVSNVPIDAPIVYAELEDVVLTIGGTEYDVTLGLQGVEVYVPDGLAKGVYDIILTATYHGALIRAAYFEALHAVEWQYLSDFQQYLVGSPIVADAAIVIGGPLTDAQLEELKEQYIAAKQAADEARAEAEAEKQEYAEKVEHLDDLATEQDVTAAKEAILAAVRNNDTTALAELLSQTHGLAALKDAIDNIHIDPSVFEGLAHELNATQNKQAILDAIAAAKLALQGDNTSATLTTILAAFGNIDFSTLAKQGDNPDATNTAILAAIAALVIPTVAQIQNGLATEENATTNKTAILNALANNSANFLSILSYMYTRQNVDGMSVINATEAGSGYPGQWVNTGLKTSGKYILFCISGAALSTGSFGACNTTQQNFPIYSYNPTTGEIGTTAIATITGSERIGRLARNSDIPSDYAKQGTNIKNLDTLKSEVVTALQGSNASAATLVAIKNLLEDGTNGLAMLAKEATLSGGITTLSNAIAGIKPEMPQVVVGNDVAAVELQPNTLYVFTNRTSNLAITLASGAAGQVAEYHMFVEVGNAAPTVSFPQSVEWLFTSPGFTPYKRTEISILNNSGIWV